MRNIRVAPPEEPVQRPRAKRPDPIRDWAATLPIAALPLVLLLVLMPTSAATPELSVSPTSAVSGTSISVSGSGFIRGERGVLTWDGRSMPSATYRANGHGRFAINLLVPADASPGVHEIAAVQTVTKRKQNELSSELSRSVVAIEVVVADPVGPEVTPEATSSSPPEADSSAAATFQQQETSSPSPSSLSATPTASPSSTAPPSPKEPPPATAQPSPTPSGSTAPCPASLQVLIDRATAGSTLQVPACTFRETLTIIKPLTLVTSGAVIDGEGVRKYGFVIKAHDVTLDGFEVTRTINPAQEGAVQVRYSDRFTLRNSSIHHTGGACFSIGGGSGHRVLDNELAYCEQQGFHLSSVTNTYVARNKIHHNNPNRAYSPGWEAGGGKAARVNGLTFEANEAYANVGPGLWCDVDCRNVVFRSNRAHNNTRMGIFVEISNGALIEGNSVWENGWQFTSWGYGGGIVVASSRNVEIRNNVVAWNADGISVISQNRTLDGLVQHVTNVYVHHNSIILAPQPSDSSMSHLLAWQQDWTGVLYDSRSNNRGAENRYWHSRSEPSLRFEWSSTLGRLSDFNATPGESSGRYLSREERDAALASARIPTSPQSR